MEALLIVGVQVAWTIMILGTLVMVGKVVYEIYYHRLYYYGIEEGHLVVSAGIFLRERGALPLTHMTDVYLERGVLDFFFRLYNLFPSNPSVFSHNYSDINGLSPESAIALQDYLAKLSEAINPELQRAVARFPPQREVATL